MIGLLIIFLSLSLIASLYGCYYYHQEYKRFKNIVLPPPSKQGKSKKEIKREKWLRIRSYILFRDGFRCQECGYYKHLEVHHIVPRSKGGTDEFSNLVTLCKECHDVIHGFKKRKKKRWNHDRRRSAKKRRERIDKKFDSLNQLIKNDEK